MPTQTRTTSRSFSITEGTSIYRVTAGPPSPGLSASRSRLSVTKLLSKFLASAKELDKYGNGQAVIVDGQNLSIAAVTAASRKQASVTLTNNRRIKERVEKSRKVMSDKVERGISVYGVSTGFGGSADTRTDQPIVLGHALLQMQHIGILPTFSKSPQTLPLLDPMASTMPEAWVRGAMLIRMNSLIRGHSGVRWELIEKMNQLLDANIIPVVPLRGSISASGDLSPLSYVAGAIIGNPSIYVFDGPTGLGYRSIVPSDKALAAHNITPLALVSKEPLGILNGTAFSASVGSLVLNDAVQLAVLAQVCTAMGAEALAGNRGSFDPFIHSIARPHPGQVECAKIIWDLLEGSQFAVTHEEEVKITDDRGHLRQDRYPLRTAPQFIGPQLEDLLASVETITQEINSTTDNPLVDGDTGTIHHGGNFQAMAVTNAMEKIRLSLHHFGKILFSQCAELVDPTMNRGLPPNLSSTDPSLDYHLKGVDIATAAYVAELGYLANPVSTHIQSCELHNQSINSMALVSGRATINSLEVLMMLISSYLYSLCQALDLRAMRKDLIEGVNRIASEELSVLYGSVLTQSDLALLEATVCCNILEALDNSTTMDASDRMKKVVADSSTAMVDILTQKASAPHVGSALQTIITFRSQLASRATRFLDELRRKYLSGGCGQTPAAKYLNKTRPVYEFVRLTLGIRMHGMENYAKFSNGHGRDEITIGQNISLIYEAIRDGRMQVVIASLF